MSRDDEIAEDAARYRWLRDRDLDAIEHGGLFVGMVPENIVINGDDLDRHVDAERGARAAVRAQPAPSSKTLLIRRIESDSDEGRRGDIEVVDPATGATTGSMTWGEMLEQIAAFFPPKPGKAYPMNTPATWEALRRKRAPGASAAEFAEAHEEAIEQERKGG